MIGFEESGHRYYSLDGSDQSWLGITTIIGSLKEQFRKEETAEKSSRNRKSKWYGMIPTDIIAAWENENKRAVTLGHWYHDKREKELWEKGSVEGLPVVKAIINNGIKIAPDQQLQEGIYPEHMIYLQSIGICGQSDEVKVHNGKVDIRDFKTSKEITTKGYTNWEGITKKMIKPVSHLEDCHINHYGLQLSLYMYMILRHNPNLSPGKMFIDHIKFVEADKDKFGYPIAHLGDGDPIVESITEIEVPYMKTEAHTLVNWLKDSKNRKTIIKH